MSLLTREANEQGEHTLKRSLGPVNLVTLGIGAVIGAGIFVLTGQAAALYAGPAVALSFVFAGITCAFAGLVLCRVRVHDSHCRVGVHLWICHAG